MSKPIAVLISDVHYSLPTLELADKAMRMAIGKANSLYIPLIVAGDLHDTKANLRAECVEALLDTFSECKRLPYVLVGNHDKTNEKSQENALRFLHEHCILVDEPMDMPLTGLHGIPYYHDPDELRAYLKTFSKGSTLIMHQGLSTSNAGHYLQDKSAISRQDVAGFRIISGHYHTRQTIALPDGGKWDYIGNPYTLNYGEANDPPKGFQVLYDDNSLEFIPTNLREHVVMELDFSELNSERMFLGTDQDLVWVKIKGTREQLSTLTKNWVGLDLDINQDFKLDLIPLESETSKPTKVNQTQPEILDDLIDSLTNTSDEQKERIKALWKDL